MTTRWRVRLVLTAVALAVLAPGAAASAGWATGTSVANTVGSARMLYAEGRSAPASPTVTLLEGGTARVQFAPTLLSGETPRAMTSYVVLAHATDGTSAVETAPCDVVLGVEEITCGGDGLTEAYARSHVFTQQPVYRSWAGAVSTPSEPLPAVDEPAPDAEPAGTSQEAPASSAVSEPDAGPAPDPGAPASDSSQPGSGAQEATADDPATPEPVVGTSAGGTDGSSTDPAQDG